MARRTIDEQLAALNAWREGTVSDELLINALASKHYRVVATAARVCEQIAQNRLCEFISRALQRLMREGHKQDPKCTAKNALAQALVGLDHDDAELFRQGLSHIQLEPVWGAAIDTAADLRAICAMGLVATKDPRALMDIVPILYDPEMSARLGAVKAVSCGAPREAELLIRSKVIAGDGEVEVIGQCFSALMAIESDINVEFVAGFLNSATPDLQQAAGLALGESRAAAAMPHLIASYESAVLDPELRRALIHAASLHRSQIAHDWLLTIAASEHIKTAAIAVEALAIFKRDQALTNRLREVIIKRADPALREIFDMAVL